MKRVRLYMTKLEFEEFKQVFKDTFPDNKKIENAELISFSYKQEIRKI